MARFDGEDRAGGGKVGFAHYVGCGAKVGGDSDAFEDRGGGDKGLNVSEGEVVGACCDGLGASGWGRSVCVVWKGKNGVTGNKPVSPEVRKLTCSVSSLDTFWMLA